ncbi:hypothetical protein DRQ36_07595, partial [bacterium]
ENCFRADPVEQGKYILWLFCDDNADSSWFPGNLKPIIPSEKAVVYPDTIDVRGLWTTDIKLTR